LKRYGEIIANASAAVVKPECIVKVVMGVGGEGKGECNWGNLRAIYSEECWLLEARGVWIRNVRSWCRREARVPR
jgi:hypothetical protein